MTQDHTIHQLLRITVHGRLSDRVAAGFDGMCATYRGGSTELVGELVDQAQLHGLLARVRDLGLDLESVLVVDCPALHDQFDRPPQTPDDHQGT